jgi:hypothetical protein
MSADRIFINRIFDKNNSMKKIFLIGFILLVSLNFLSAQPTSWTSRGVGGGGALFAPSINPANPQEYYIACDMSELFHTTDFGLTYSQVNFAEFIGGNNSKVCFTSGGLYSISYINDIATPVKSIDGVTWTWFTGNPDPSSDVYTIDADYYNPNRVIISFYGEIYFSADGGITFTLIHTCLDNGAGNIVGGVFFDGTNIYIGTNDGILVSTNSGTSWTTAAITGITSGQRIFSFAAAKNGGTTRFFCLTANTGDLYVGLVGSDYWDFMQGVYSCDYGSTNWTSKMTGINVGTDYPMFVAMAQNDINTAYLGGSNSSSEPIVLKTSNAGTNWANTFLATNNQNIITGWSGDGGDKGWSWGECPFGISVCPTNANYIIFGDYGFCHKTSDGGTTWQQAYTDDAFQHPANALTPKYQDYQSIGMENTTCWQVHWSDANNLWASYSDIGGIRSDDGGDSWSFNYTGNSVNTTYRVAQGSNGTLYAGTSNIHDMYQSTRLQDAILDAADANGKIVYSTDDGQNWQLLHNFGHPVFWVALDPNNPNRAYASVIQYSSGSGLGGIYRCDDLNNLASSTWTLIPAPTRTEKHPACMLVLNDGKLVATYSGRRNSSGTFTASSGCFIYDPTGNSWTDVSDPGMYYWTKDIVVDPNDVTQNTWYVSVFSGWGGAPNGLGGLYKTINRGTSWTKLTGSTLDRVTSCTLNPSDADQIYVTTEYQGLWISSNINSGTPTFSNVSSYPFKQPERVFFNPYDSNEIWVASFGNGMKSGTLTATGIPEFSEDAFNVYPNPAEGMITVELGIAEGQKLCIYDMLGKIVAEKTLVLGKNIIDVSEFQAGIYLFKAGSSSKKIIVE